MRLCGLFLALLISSQSGVTRASGENAFLDRFAGAFDGDGYYLTFPITDSFEARWVLGGNYLTMITKATDGNDFESDAFVRFNAQSQRFEYYELNTDQVPEPRFFMTGKLVGNTLVLEEPPANIRHRFTFESIDEDTFVMTKDQVHGQKVTRTVTLTFHRRP
jgi:hypothetical protein